jgi:nucleotide-binding universal stress UspA family protein
MHGHGTEATIVCGIDDPVEAQSVLDTARWLAAACDGQLVVVHAFDEPVRDAEHVMLAIRDHTDADRNVEIRLVEGAPAERLLEVAGEERADFLVVGSRGRGALASGLLGSVSRSLVRTAACPVVIVPPKAAPPTAGTGDDAAIVCGVDGSDHARAAARLAAELARRLGLRVAVVHAPRSKKSLSYVGRSTTPSLSQQPDQVDRRSLEIVQEAVDALGDVPSAVYVEPGRPDQVLEAVAGRERGRLIVIAGRGAGPVSASVLGSVAHSLVTSADVPIVVLTEAAERAGTEAGSIGGSATPGS